MIAWPAPFPTPEQQAAADARIEYDRPHGYSHALSIITR